MGVGGGDQRRRHCPTASKDWGAGVELQQQPSQDFLGDRGPQEEEVAWLGPRVGGGRYHALAGVSDAAGLVQEAAVLQLLTEPLQSVEWLVELHRH